MKAEKKRARHQAKLGGAEMAVAARLKQLRHEQRLTLSQLAAASGFSSGFLSRVENHKISIPIASLEKLAAALGVALGAFFENKAEGALLSLCRRDGGRRGRLRGRHGFSYESLAGTKKGKLMEPMIVDVASAQRRPTPRPHSGDEFNYILEGECDLVYGKQKIRLRSGDAVYYDASVPHTSIAVAGAPCRMLVVVASRDYLFHGDLARLLNAGAR